jgi:hypothetical protein
MVKEFIHGLMVKCMMDNGRMESSMAMEYGKVTEEIHTLGNGNTQKQKGTESTLGETV